MRAVPSLFVDNYLGIHSLLPISIPTKLMMFEEFTNDQALGLTENQSHWYIKALSYGQRPWPALGQGFNTGVMLMHLQQLPTNNRSFIASELVSDSYRIKRTFVADTANTHITFVFPANKDELLKFLKRGILYTFRYHVWTQGHAATNYSYWRNTMEPYQVSWEPDFEPYIVVSKLAPRYDTRFIGFGWNKVSYLTHLTVLDYKCLKKLKDEFVEELVMRYGLSTLLKLKKMTKEERILKFVESKK
ncbi:hypothetical protein E2986_01911 [Frieseomelitta varia]|uniref:Uncharacterized protein n=1 Tax=Frieseomelitta varia TaxID=561572 RepID=A0A833RWP2_9HYME|nr:hypothetical protein E2986_01911 [Frieseomelitta varia]